MQAANACFTQMNILLPSFNSDSVRTETMDSDVEPNFFVAYSSVSLSTHIRMLLELSSFANEFFKQVFSHLPSHVEPALVRAPANQKQGGEPRNQSNFTQTAFEADIFLK